jgi:nucleoside-diphosphate-sugar epimerase
MSMKVLVAGATGAIGAQLVPQLLEQGHEVAALTRSRERAGALAAAGAEPVVCDVFDREALVDEVRRRRPEVVVNELTDLPDRLDPRRLDAIYAPNNRVRREGTANLLAAARAGDAGRVITQSAAFWYAPGDGLRTEEDPLDIHAPEPIGQAVRTIRGVEDAVLQEPGLTGIVLRYGQFYGPGTWFAWDGDVGRRMRARRYPVVGDGAAVSSFVHVSDAARATVAALTAPAGVYNVVDDEPAEARVWMPVYAEALGAPPPRRVPRRLAALLAGSGFIAWVTSTPGADNRKAKSALGWTPRYPSWRQGFAEALG